MREIKFRAWEKTSELMVYDIQNVSRKRIIGESACESFQEVLDSWEYETMQYTGLKDKNGKEIYEGDILEIEPEDKEYYPQNSIFYVTIHRSLWGYKFGWDHVSGYGSSLHITEIDDEHKRLLNVEVIGNIYENPELLEVGK